MNHPEDRLARRLMQEVVDRTSSPPEWEDVVARLAPAPSTVTRPAIRRPWLLVATAAGVVAAAMLGAVAYQRSGTDTDRSFRVQTGSTTSAPAPTAAAAPSTSGAPAGVEQSSIPADGTALFLPSRVPAGFAVVEASTYDGVPEYAMPFVSTETWIDRDADGRISGIVQLRAYKRFEPPNLLPPEPTGLTVHEEVAQLLTTPGGSEGSAVSWDEQHLTLFVTSWGADAVAIAERSVVSASGITLPSGALPHGFVRGDAEPNLSLAGGTSSSVQWATSDGASTLSLSARPNSRGATTDTLGATPGMQPRAVGNRRVWLRAADGAVSATWLDGEYVLSADGTVDEDTLLDLIGTVGRTSRQAFDVVVAQASAIDEAVTERDRAVFADGLAASMHSDAPIDVPETSSFGPRSLCVRGDRTICDGVTPYTEGGLLVMVAATRTINGERELLLWTASSRTVTRAFERDTEVDLPFVGADGTVGAFVRVTAPPGVRTIVVQFQDAGEPGLGAASVNLDPADPRADVLAPGAPPG